jgi:hypothetical protein
VAQCKYCKKEITWIKEGRKNVPVESDGGIHECDEFKKTIKSIKKFDRGSLSPEEIAKYEQGINKKK